MELKPEEITEIIDKLKKHSEALDEPFMLFMFERNNYVSTGAFGVIDLIEMVYNLLKDRSGEKFEDALKVLIKGLEKYNDTSHLPSIN